MNANHGGAGKSILLLLLSLLILLAAVYLLFVRPKGSPPPAAMDAQEIFRVRNLGLAHLEENRLEEAQQDFRELIRLAPEEAIGHANLALALLRTRKFLEAEESARAATQRAPGNPDIALILAEIYEQTDRVQDAVMLLEATVQAHPFHARSRYKLAQLLLRTAPDGPAVREHLRILSEQQPALLPVRLLYLETLVRAGNTEEAVRQLQSLRMQLPSADDAASTLLQKNLDALHAASPETAANATMLHNVLKPSPSYQAAIQELRGPGGAFTGFPITAFSPQFLSGLSRAGAAALAISFRESPLSVPADLATFGDIDGDGDPDLYTGGRILRNDAGKYAETASLPEISEADSCAAFADFDNDGDLDLYRAGAASQSLFRNDGGPWKEVTTPAQLPPAGGCAQILILDLDQDGDLDFYRLSPAASTAYRNNGDGTFTVQSEAMGLAAGATAGAFGDFDDDGDVDLITTGSSGIHHYTNLREGKFQAREVAPGLNATVLAIVDWDNDGDIDLLAGTTLFTNSGNAEFVEDAKASAALRQAFPGDTTTAAFADFDNDGLADLFLSGAVPRLLRNTGANFQDAPSVFPHDFSGIRHAVIQDVDQDGDPDIAVTLESKQLTLLKNEGGNANHWLSVRLSGLGAASGKNNRFGIGARLEVMAGDTIQTRTVTGPVTHFGLGAHQSADVVRVVWTNGVPQNRIEARANQTIVEEQVLKGSCAFLYAWNGQRFDFVTDIVWRSALGMPLGIMGGATAYAPADASREYVRIASRQLQPANGKLSLRITEELWEDSYLDEVTLISVDHPAGSEIYVDEKFVPPPYPDLHIYAIAARKAPRSAVNESGFNLLPYILEKDDAYTPNLIPTRFQGITTLHDLILDPGDLDRSGSLILFLNGWIFPSDASINVALGQGAAERAIAPYVEAEDSSGRWIRIADAGFPAGKDKTVIVDLTGKVPQRGGRIRIRTSMEIYWDQVFFAAADPQIAVQKTSAQAQSADLRYRGFSRVYRKGPYGPQWFDYENVSREQKWRDLAGMYTRFGDVLPLLARPDSKYVILNAADEIALEFDASAFPALPHGWTRDYLLYTTGWVKDGDLNTATSNTVEPLPFHGMSRYPYGPDEAYPQTPEYQEYLRNYNTRRVEHRIPSLR